MAKRAGELIKRRNEKIYHRYKELYDINYLRHERVLDLLSDEFFILPKSIQKIVSEGRKALSEPNKKKVNKMQLSDS